MKKQKKKKNLRGLGIKREWKRGTEIGKKGEMKSLRQYGIEF